MAKWNFACGDGVTVRGLNNGDIDGFKGSPIRSLAREICQNSLDALPKALKALRDEGKSVPPVKIEFAEFEGTVPQKNELLESLENMLAYWKMRQKQDMKVVEFLNLAIKCIKKGKIPYLRISDFNTTGLCGIAGVGTPWDNLITSVGASDKPSDAGGSKGIIPRHLPALISRRYSTRRSMMRKSRGFSALRDLSDEARRTIPNMDGRTSDIMEKGRLGGSR